MSEDENREKRSLTDAESGLFKKQKLDDEMTLPILSNALVLDKTQEDTINQLVQSSLVNETAEKADPKLTEDTNKSAMEPEIVSADIEKPVTATATAAAATAPVEKDKSVTVPATATDDLNITSEQLLFALTSIPPTEEESSDISAALRRLSSHSVPASVIEQLSSSPRLPHIGHLNPNNNNNNNNERRASMATDVSPSEMLGNALAAVAANAAAASRSSPKPSPVSNTSSNHATTAAIGSLAAITANISNLLHSGGFHRNSFSQEDTQKLAAAVAVARNGSSGHQQHQQQQQVQTQRRKSSMAVVGNAFSNMIEMMGRKPAIPKPKLIIKNEQVWKSLQGVHERSLGFQVYTPQLILPHLERCLNGVMEIRVPARYLTFENMRVKKRALWGTDIYTDDSDIVAMAIHSGKYQPQFIEPDIGADDPFALAVAGKQRESTEAAKRLALSGKKWVRHDNLIPDHDLKVTVRVLPTLKNYASCIRYRLKSREWGKHDGMSLYVDKVEKVKKGEARLKGRSTIKSNLFAYEPYRKQALGLTQKIVKQEDNLIQESMPHFQRGRVKKSPRVMRMFKGAKLLSY
ncbi:histone deacetylation protein Rxt3-domain-containing protein [Mucor mucedo]|uniref:histone deacetylation protein Rxt3-domain-containing protein n=1 Tax=Mucor mucedo TaxID=29922 RepID=UPI002220BF55|nr:histone deacetylation protein Rxt3-domain-containing protein [Mucor mucedo]KAI7894755.1 histone deacetylation protein Rxt3-domain-containing protein [Mucor mucedo]